jgi:hypothetical protein
VSSELDLVLMQESAVSYAQAVVELRSVCPQLSKLSQFMACCVESLRNRCIEDDDFRASSDLCRDASDMDTHIAIFCRRRLHSALAKYYYPDTAEYVIRRFIDRLADAEEELVEEV